MNRARTQWSRPAGAAALLLLGWLAAQLDPRLAAQGPAKPAVTPAAAATYSDPDKNIVALVNGQAITRRDLGEELIARRGKQQLEFLINKRIIEQAAQKAGITATDAEVEQDLRKILSASNIPAADFEKKLLREQGFASLYEYKEDAIRTGILVRKLAGQRVQVTPEDLQKSFEANYGEKVECRIIWLTDRSEALRIHTEIKNDPAAFLKAASKYGNLKSVAGKVRPINRFSSMDQLEKAAFAMNDNEISPVLEAPQGYVILLRERLIPADTTKKLEDVKEELVKDLTEKKLQIEVPKLIKELKDQAVIRDYLNNKYDIKEAMERSLPSAAAPGAASPSPVVPNLSPVPGITAPAPAPPKKDP